ncbi:unnamed protein product [Lactuca virosa]|uniref:Ion transport domain-containing protein n=1 Tax=Lactuca virosa TaxID=75947 RepID=A0AAU9NGF7_9ASTR|nr:unnamed protein product [Lactuca virosa]
MRSEIGWRTLVEEEEEEREEERRRKAEAEEDGVIKEYGVKDLGDHGRLGKRWSAWDLGLNRDKVSNGRKGSSHGLVIHPRNRWYRAWEKFILLWAMYSSFFTPMEFGFFRGLPNHLYLLDIICQTLFFIDIVLQFFIAFRDIDTEKMIFNPNLISLRYLQSHFILDLLACIPWDIIYKACGRKEEVRYLLLIRLVRTRKVLEFFSKMEKDIRVKYLFSRILKLIVVELYCTHTAACIFYYLATTLPANEEEYTWIGSLKLGDYSYSTSETLIFGNAI